MTDQSLSDKQSDNKEISDTTTTSDDKINLYLECGDCCYFSFFEFDETFRGKCNRDSFYSYQVVNAFDKRCKPCSSCKHITENNHIYSCKYVEYITIKGYSINMRPHCNHYEI